MNAKRRNGFTLVELLVVIAIIGILIALLLPAVQAAREAARRVGCLNNMTQLALAVQQYEGAYRVYPAGTIEDGGPVVNVAEGYHHNWLSKILPYLEQQVTYSHIDFNVGVYHDNNSTVREIEISVFGCPSDPNAYAAQNSTSYAGLHHDQNAPIDANNAVWINRRQVDLRSVRSIIERLHAENPKGTLVIQADRESKNDTLVQVMDASRRAGVYDIALAAHGPIGEHAAVIVWPGVSRAMWRSASLL